MGTFHLHLRVCCVVPEYHRLLKSRLVIFKYYILLYYYKLNIKPIFSPQPRHLYNAFRIRAIRQFYRTRLRVAPHALPPQLIQDIVPPLNRPRIILSHSFYLYIYSFLFFLPTSHRSRRFCRRA